MDRFTEMALFVEVADRGSLGAAAEALGLSNPAATRYLASLEERLQGLGLKPPLLIVQSNGGALDVKEAARLENWIDEALGKGAALLCGGKRDETCHGTSWGVG